MWTETGWQSSYGLIMNAQCVLCRVWVAEDKKRLQEFDGMPHHCTDRQRERAPAPFELEAD